MLFEAALPDDLNRGHVEGEAPAANEMSQRLHGDADVSRSGSSLVRRVATPANAVACVPPILYLVYVNHFSVDALYGDDWNMVRIMDSALHGQLSFNQFWSQYSDARIPVAKGIFILFAFANRFDTRSVILLSAVLLVAAYAMLLVLFRHYLGRRLTPVPVLLVGLVWFSLASVQTALWAFLLTWYLVVFFFLTVLFALVVPNRHRNLWFGVALVAAILASFSFLQGLIVWPVAAICIVWCQPWSRRVAIEFGTWVGAMVVTSAVYFSGYSVAMAGCFSSNGCRRGVAFSHPLRAFRYVILLIGNVIPGGYLGSTVHDLARFEVVGAALLMVSLFIIVQSWRYRRSAEHLPIPLFLILFALLFDVTIAIGRTGAGPRDAIVSNRYVMPNIVLLTGIVIYALPRIPPLRLPTTDDGKRVYATWIALLALAIVVGVQVVVATGFGLNNARLNRADLLSGVHLVVHLDRIAPSDRGHELQRHQISGSEVCLASKDFLGEFGSAEYSPDRSRPPIVLRSCKTKAQYDRS
jgi:hypothetical protein